MKIDKNFLDTSFQTQAEVFEFLGKAMEDSGIVLKYSDYLLAVKDLEDQGTTGLIDGFAIPHGKSPAIKQAAVIYICNKQGIEWSSLDGS